MPAPVNRRSAYASTVSTGLNVLDLSGQYTRQATEVPRTDQRHHGFEENELAEAVLVSLDQPLRQVGTQRPQVGRSEEHTSELQSRFDLVCRLLLEKKNEKNKKKNTNTTS